MVRDMAKKQTTKQEEPETEDSTGREEGLEQQVLQLDNQYKRALADYQNLEKRVVEEKRETVKRANRDLLLRLLPVLDTLILAEEHIQNDGLKVSINQFLDTLKSEGVVKIETAGKPFDPSLMEAIGTDKGDEHIVVRETRAGYLLNGELLRAAQVIVGEREEVKN